MTLLTQNSTRLNRSATIGEVLGAKPDEPLELNTAEAATCGRCGKEPRLFHHVSPKGRDVMVWIPADHTCTGRRQA